MCRQPLAVGAQQDSRSGAWRSGAVDIYEWQGPSWNPKPIVTALGESYWTDARFGHHGAAIRRGDQTTVYIGAYRGTPTATYQDYRDNGAVYVLPLP